MVRSSETHRYQSACLPAGLMDVLQGEHLRVAVQVNAILCLVSTCHCCRHCRSCCCCSCPSHSHAGRGAHAGRISIHNRGSTAFISFPRWPYLSRCCIIAHHVRSFASCRLGIGMALTYLGLWADVQSGVKEQHCMGMGLK